MSKNAVYTKHNFNNPSINIRQREKSMSVSPHKTSTQQRRTFMPSGLKNEELQSTEAKRYRQNEEEYADYRAGHQQRTSKKPSYPPVHQSSTGYSNNAYQAPPANNKLELLKQQNLYLSQQNVHLNELVLQKNKIISTLQKKLDYQIQQQVTTLEQIEREKNKFLNEFHTRDDQQRIQIEKLLIEVQNANEDIGRLNFQKKEILLERDRQISLIKSGYTEQNRHLIDNVISKKDTELKSLELQLNELQSVLDQMNVELRTQKQSAQMTQNHLNQQLSRVLQELEQVNHDKKIQISEQKIAFENIILTINKQKQQEVASVIFKYEVEIKKLKNQLKEQMLANSNLQSLLESAKLHHTDEVQKRFNEQTQLKHHMHEMKLFYQQKEHDEMQKQKKLNFQQHQMLLKAMEIKNLQYEEDLKKLISVNKQNKTEIDRLYTEIQKLRSQKKDEVERVEKINYELREKISELIQASEDQSEALKVKMGQLRHSDITTLKQYYQNELALKLQQILDLQKAVKENREKLHKELEEKVIQRKHHERQVDDLRIKVTQLELKIASIVEQNKQQMNSMGSQIQMTSLTLIKETTQKQKYSKQSETQKKNLQEIITKKDEEIQQLNSKMILIKKSHTEQITQKQQTVTLLQQKSEQLNDQIRREREFYQKEIYKKQQAKKQTKEFYEIQIQKQKETYSREFTQTTQKLMMEKNQLAIQIQHLLLAEKQLKEELALHSEHQQQRTLQKEVSFNEEKARLQYAKQNAQISMRNYYEKRVIEIQEELSGVKQQLSEKNQDIRSLNEKNYKLQKKLERLVESQEKMRVLEQRVLAIGQENNIVKNMAQLSNTKSRRKPI